MKKAYYTQLNVISLALPFCVVFEGKSFQIDVPVELGLIQSAKHVIHNSLHEKVAAYIETDDFFLIPSRIQVELDAYQAYVQANPDKFPMEDDGMSYGLGRMRDDS